MGVLYSTLRSIKDRKWDEIDDSPSPKENELMFQGFEWHVEADQQHWNRLRESIPRLKSMGVSNIWIPPGCKATTPSGNGYDIYDLYDVGEFDQKGSRATKWGTREDLESFISKAEEAGIGIYWDAVLNHKAAADHTEKCMAVEVDPENRNAKIGEPAEIEGWLGYEFPGRGTKYSSMKYHWNHFTGIDYDLKTEKSGIYKILGDGKGWATDVSRENGNYDYLIFADVDFSNAEVREDVKNWVEWLGQQFPIKGMRFDATKHYSREFLKELVAHIRQTVGPRWFLVAEYWKEEFYELANYLQQMDNLVSLFDVPLTDNFLALSKKKGADLRTVFECTLAQHSPEHAVTFVTNHDTQPGQSLEMPVRKWFKPLAYALIFLRQEGYPCLFYGDLYGINNCPQKEKMAPVDGLSSIARARKLYAYGKQRDYFDQKNCIGFVRYGDPIHPFGLACVFSNGPPTSKRMYVGRKHAQTRWTEVFGFYGSTVTIDRYGYGNFGVKSNSVSVWVDGAATGRDEFY